MPLTYGPMPNLTGSEAPPEEDAYFGPGLMFSELKRRTPSVDLGPGLMGGAPKFSWEDDKPSHVGGALPGGIPLRQEPYPDLNNPLGLPPMRVQGSPGTPGAPVQAAAPKPSPIRAVRMPDGKIVFTNLGQEGGTVLSAEESAKTARAVGAAGPQAPAYTPNGRDADMGEITRLTDLRQMVERAGIPGAGPAPEAAPRVLGSAVPAVELSPGDDGLGTPGFYQAQENQAQDRLGGYQRRAEVADAATHAKSAEAWAAMSPEQRRAAIAADEAAKKPNFPLQVIAHLQAQVAQLDQKAEEIQRGLSTLVNVDNPETKRLKAEAAAKLAEIAAQKAQIIQIGGLPYRTDTSMIGSAPNPYNPAGAGAIAP